MKVLALVSGGKDSCYCATVCRSYGHDVVALANLAPDPSLGREDLESWMYQTVGHAVVGRYHTCTGPPPRFAPSKKGALQGLPLFRLFTRGEAATTRLSYRPVADDEVEDLLRLVAYAKDRLPEIEAVCSGAIASDYQRLRVEDVCRRVGVVSLAFLWKRPQLRLFDDIIAAPIDAVLVKVAAMGLLPHKHLGKGLTEMRSELLSLRERFGSNVCGEGGEYETLVLDCPLFEYGKIVIDSAQVCTPDGSGTIASVGLYDIQAFNVQAKAEGGEGQVHWVPPDFVPQDQSQPRALFKDDPDLTQRTVALTVQESSLFLTYRLHPRPKSSPSAPHVLFLMLSALVADLERRQLSLRDAVFVQLYLGDMDMFQKLNEIYALFFPELEPPSRACVEISRLQTCVLEILVLKERGPRVQRNVLHVQSRSNWAPNCIGPYSQATSVNAISFVAGQLGFIPHCMTVAEGWRVQLERALEHCQAVAVAIGGDLRKSTVKAIFYLTPELLSELRSSSDDAADFEAVISGVWPKGSSESLLDASEDLDVYLKPPAMRRRIRPLIALVGVERLPRDGACVEIQPIVVSCKGLDTSERRAAPFEVWSEAVDCGACVESLTVRTVSLALDLRCLQLRVPLMSNAAGDLLRVKESCAALLDRAAQSCPAAFVQIGPATAWYVGGAAATELLSFLESAVERHAGVAVQWTVLPAKALGLDARLCDMILLDWMTLPTLSSVDAALG